MNILLWIIQILLAIHTLIGAVWKFYNLELTLPFVNPIPPAGWIVISILEIICSIVLILPLFKKSLGAYVPFAAIAIAAEMVIFSAMHLNAGHPDKGPLIYWLVVAVICAFLSYARRSIRPIR
ncbi:MAG: hypothetical protein EOP04_23720 [Proteobacteria bacterium]|nr:MAG: hypothetical protein EOP04_23720 [Pseudomonadota bacterium]